MGGGVTIKPVLDSLGFHSLNGIAFYSSIAAFVMSIFSIYKQYQDGTQIEWKKVASISLGSLVGGMLGDLLLNQAVALALNEEKVQLVRYIIVSLTLILVPPYNQFSNWHLYLNGLSIFLIVRLGLGALSTFLDIGDSPINVVCLILFFGMDIRLAIVYSVITTFFS